MAKKIQNKTGAFLATGRRKKSIARVRLYPGKGEFTINNRGVEEYLQRDTLILIAKQPLTLTGTTDKFDVVVNVIGGGLSGQAGAIRHGIARALVEASETYKKELKEQEIRTMFITPALQKKGWTVSVNMREEYYFTDGRVLVVGNQHSVAEGKKADYLLYHNGKPIAVVEAKDNKHAVGGGMQQAIDYAMILDLKFAYSSNGDAFLVFNDLSTFGTCFLRFSHQTTHTRQLTDLFLRTTGT